MSKVRLLGAFNNRDSALCVRRTHGPLIHTRAIDKVEAHVKDAVARGASVLIGGKRAESLGPNFFEPTVLADVPPDVALTDEETFGPVAALIKYALVSLTLIQCALTLYVYVDLRQKKR